MPSRLWCDDAARASLTLFVLSLTPLPDASGRRWRFFSSFQDGPRPKRAQEALTSRKRAQRTPQESPGGMRTEMARPR
eukprot:3099261-Pyramimonas_sp.AAC.1